MGSFTSKITKEVKRVGSQVGNEYTRWNRKVDEERRRIKSQLEDPIKESIGIPSKRQKVAERKANYATEAERYRVGPTPTDLTGEMDLNGNRRRRRRQFSLMTGLGDLDLNKPKLLG